MQPNYTKKSTIDPVPPGKIRLHFHVIPVRQSVLIPAILFLISNQLRSANSTSTLFPPSVEPSQVSSLRTDFSCRLQSLGNEILLHKSAIANRAG
jgi:hypothetical protein